MHFPIDAEKGAIGIDDDGGVVIEPGGPLFEQRGDDHDTVLAGEALEQACGGAGDGFSQFEILVVLGLTKVNRWTEFLGADDLRTSADRSLGELKGFLEVFFGF